MRRQSGLPASGPRSGHPRTRPPARGLEGSIMVEHRRGLGRGLSALLEETEAAAEEPNAVSGVRVAPIELLRRNPDQPRRTFPDEEIDGLATSIREKGLLQP